MPIERELFLNPYSWIFLSGLFTGACLGRLPFLFFRERRRSGWSRWVSLGAVFLSLAIIAVGLALFLPRGGLFGQEPLDLTPFQSGTWLIPFGAALVLGILGFRFPRAAGIPLLVVAVTAGIFFFLALQSFRSVETETLLEYQILKAHGDSRVIRLLFPDDREMILTLEGRNITPQFEVITAPAWFFPLSPGRFSRIPRLERTGSPESLPFRAPMDLRPFWGDSLARVSRIIPFLRYEQWSFQDDFPERSGSFIMDRGGSIEFSPREP